MTANLIVISGSEVQCGDIFNSKVITYVCVDWQGAAIRLHDGTRDFILSHAQILVNRPAALIEERAQDGNDALPCASSAHAPPRGGRGLRCERDAATTNALRSFERCGGVASPFRVEARPFPLLDARR